MLLPEYNDLVLNVHPLGKGHTGGKEYEEPHAGMKQGLINID
jgi:hypothetical protein